MRIIPVICVLAILALAFAGCAAPTRTCSLCESCQTVTCKVTGKECSGQDCLDCHGLSGTVKTCSGCRIAKQNGVGWCKECSVGFAGGKVIKCEECYTAAIGGPPCAMCAPKAD